MTPLEAMRDALAGMRDELEVLRARAAEVVAAWQREDDSIADAIEVLGRTLEVKR